VPQKQVVPLQILVSDPKQPKLATVVGKQIKSEVDLAVARMCYSTGISQSCA